MYHYAVFDMDGTILDTLTDVTNSLNWALKKHGLPTHTQDEVRHMVGNGVQHLVECAVPADTPEEVVAAVLADNKAHYAAHCNDTTKPYPGIMDLLRHLKGAGVKLAVVSNKPNNAVQELVRDVFGGIFNVALGQRDDIPRKPNPEMVHLALEQLAVSTSSNGSSKPGATSYAGSQESAISAGSHPTSQANPTATHIASQSDSVTDVASSQTSPKAVYIGDSEIDIKTASNAQLPAFLVLWGFRTKKELQEAGGKTFFSNTQDLERAILA